MSYFLEVPLDDGEPMLVEITGQVDDVVPVGRSRDVVGRLPETLRAGLDRAQAFAGEVLTRMRAYPEPPDVVAVEFGLKLTAKTGVVIAESTGEAHLKVVAQWHRSPVPPVQDPTIE
ncbi:MAG TPA: CU044_2847 family protein [Thermomonospora sp.]|nr:CU044_2847 family protein [Thermomonospora sp.]